MQLDIYKVEGGGGWIINIINTVYLCTKAFLWCQLLSWHGTLVTTERFSSFLQSSWFVGNFTWENQIFFLVHCSLEAISPQTILFSIIWALEIYTDSIRDFFFFLRKLGLISKVSVKLSIPRIKEPATWAPGGEYMTGALVGREKKKKEIGKQMRLDGSWRDAKESANTKLVLKTQRHYRRKEAAKETRLKKQQGKPTKCSTSVMRGVSLSIKVRETMCLQLHAV